MVPGEMVDDAKILRADIEVSRYVLHCIDDVLIRQFEFKLIDSGAVVRIVGLHKRRRSNRSRFVDRKLEPMQAAFGNALIGQLHGRALLSISAAVSNIFECMQVIFQQLNDERDHACRRNLRSPVIIQLNLGLLDHPTFGHRKRRKIELQYFPTKANELASVVRHVAQVNESFCNFIAKQA